MTDELSRQWGNKTRTQERAVPNNILVDITDGDKAFTDCIIEDLSFNGISVSNIPKVFNEKSIRCKGLILIEGGKNIKVDLIPRWVKNYAGNKHVGFFIEDIDPRLVRKVSNLLQDKDKDKDKGKDL
jgi:hypothetical protein